MYLDTLVDKCDRNHSFSVGRFMEKILEIQHELSFFPTGDCTLALLQFILNVTFLETEKKIFFFSIQRKRIIPKNIDNYFKKLTDTDIYSHSSSLSLIEQNVPLYDWRTKQRIAR